MSQVLVCTHYQFGFCKHKNFCRKRHVEERCENSECNSSSCEKRHPISCKYFEAYKRCKFGEFCAFDHRPPYNPLQEEINTLKAKIDDLEKEIKSKNTEILQALERLEIQLADSRETKTPRGKPANLNNSVVNRSTTMSTVTFPENIPNVDTNSRIPQLDGLTENVSELLYCENCEKSFERKGELDLHIELHGYGCDEDECRISFTSKYLADLHELEIHPETTYARDYIPSSTKDDFERGKRCTP